jgi:hypothetical protein
MSSIYSDKSEFAWIPVGAKLSTDKNYKTRMMRSYENHMYSTEMNRTHPQYQILKCATVVTVNIY